MIQNFFQLSFSDDASLRHAPNEDNVLKHFSRIKHRIISMDEASQILLRSNYPGLYQAFVDVNPYSFKADLVKFYLVYKFGGWYSDVNNYFSINDYNVDDVELLLFRDTPEYSDETSVTCGLFYAKPGNKIMKLALDKAIENIENRFYGDQPLQITGPMMFGKIAKQELGELTNLNRFYFCDDDKNRAYFLGNEVFSYYKPFGNSHGQSNIPGGNNYVEMWNNNDVY